MSIESNVIGKRDRNTGRDQIVGVLEEHTFWWTMGTIKRGGCEGPRRSAAERSYPTPKNRGGDRRPPGCDSAGAAERSHPKSDVRGGGGEQPPTSDFRGGGREEPPTSKERRLCGRRRAERSYSAFKVRRGYFVQGKEQRMRFAGAAVKR